MMVTRIRRVQAPGQSVPIQRADSFDDGLTTWSRSGPLASRQETRTAPSPPITYQPWGPMYLNAQDVRSAFRSPEDPVTYIIMSDGSNYEVAESAEEIGMMIGDELKSRQRTRSML